MRFCEHIVFFFCSPILYVFRSRSTLHVTRSAHNTKISNQHVIGFESARHHKSAVTLVCSCIYRPNARFFDFGVSFLGFCSFLLCIIDLSLALARQNNYKSIKCSRCLCSLFLLVTVLPHRSPLQWLLVPPRKKIQQQTNERERKKNMRTTTTSTSMLGGVTVHPMATSKF